MDPHSLANIDCVKTSHINLNLRIDFERKALVGYVELTAEVLKDGTETLVLDSNHLTVSAAVIDGK